MACEAQYAWRRLVGPLLVAAPKFSKRGYPFREPGRPIPRADTFTVGRAPIHPIFESSGIDFRGRPASRRSPLGGWPGTNNLMARRAFNHSDRPRPSRASERRGVPMSDYDLQIDGRKARS